MSEHGRGLTPATLSRTILRLRCPYCGRSPAFRSMFDVHRKCAVCGYVLDRGNPAYFSGAIIINYLLGAGASLAIMLVTVLIMWPDVPWRVLGYASPAVVIVLVLLLHPVSKAILMAVDVRMRPITEAELMAESHEESRVRAHHT